MKSNSRLLPALLVHVPLAAYAGLDDVYHCKQMEDDAERLSCYDEYFERAESDHVVEISSDPGTASQSEASAVPQPDATPVSEFGAERMEKTFDGQLEAHLVGDFEGWSGTTVFRLDNGQVWQQTRNYIRNYTPRNPIPGPKVTITKGVFGSYNMRIEGVKRIVQVKRIK